MNTRSKDNRQKPKKPSPNFPLYAHAGKQWAKKIKGRTYYFGDWDDPDAALEEYHRQVYYIQRGEPVPSVDPNNDLTLGEFNLAYVEMHRERTEMGKITRRTFIAIQRTCILFVDVLGKTRPVTSLGPADFDKVAKRLGKYSPVVQRNHMKRIKSLFKWGKENDYIEKLPKFGTNFAIAELEVRKHSLEQDPKFFTAEEIHRLMSVASPIMKCMLYLGINCGLGNSDIGQLTWNRLDLKTAWLEYPRPKTGMPRRAKLWPETVDQLKAVKKIKRKRLPGNGKLVFVTERGMCWHKDRQDSPISKEFSKLKKKLKMKKPGIGFYALRHTFKTVGDLSNELVAVERVMGHVPEKEKAVSEGYREMVSDKRLFKVAKYVRKWFLKGKPKE